MTSKTTMRTLERICMEAQCASIAHGPEKSWGSVLKLYPSFETDNVMEDIHGTRFVNAFAANRRGG